MKCELLETTLDLLKTTDKPMMQIAENTGLSLYWINSMRYKKTPSDPGVTKLVKLYEYLSGKTLDV